MKINGKIETQYHPSWEEKGRHIAKIEEEMKSLEDEVNEGKTHLKEELVAGNIARYNGREVIMTRRVSPKRYFLPVQNALQYASVDELLQFKVIQQVDIKKFKELIGQKNITVPESAYIVGQGGVEYLTIRLK